MSKKYFGTDGIRGTANQGKVTAEMVLKVGLAAGKYFRRGGDRRHSVVIGKDTRLSGYMIEPALTAGFTAAGMDVFLFGPLPTPAVAMMTRSLRADLGVMITASHNPYHDNGLKLFGPDGRKLSDAAENAIEKLMDEDYDQGLAAPDELGRTKRIDDAQARYVEICKATFPRRRRLNGLRIVVDCANGASYKVAPAALWELGAEVIPIGVSPNGFNVNLGCGSTHPEKMCEAVQDQDADIGIAFDGDADRLIICDEKGQVIDGDQILALLADSFYENGDLTRPGIVATVMSNLGLERYLKAKDLELIRTSVGDRHVAAHMREHGYNVGGEQSGHILMTDYATTGDGLIAALQVLGALVRADKPASELLHRFEPVPQILNNVKYFGASPLERDDVKAAIKDAESDLKGKGRLLVRMSGTEPLVRVMAEGDDPALVKQVTDDLAKLIAAQ